MYFPTSFEHRPVFEGGIFKNLWYDMIHIYFKEEKFDFAIEEFLKLFFNRKKKIVFIEIFDSQIKYKL